MHAVMPSFLLYFVMAGLVRAMTLRIAILCLLNRDARHKAGHDDLIINF
jgi:hypothetical protein